MTKPKSGHEHKRDGTFRPNRHAGQADVLIEPQKPDQMGLKVEPSAQWVWDLVTELLPVQVQSQLDKVALDGLCRWWAQWDEYMRLEREARDIADYKEAYKFQMMAMMAWKQVKDLSVKFGLTPTDRPRLKSPTVDKEVDGLSELGKVGSGD